MPGDLLCQEIIVPDQITCAHQEALGPGSPAQGRSCSRICLSLPVPIIHHSLLWCGCLGSCCPTLGCSRGCCSSSLLGKLTAPGVCGAPPSTPPLPNCCQLCREHLWVPTEPLCSSFPSPYASAPPGATTRQRPGRAVRNSLCPSKPMSRPSRVTSIPPAGTCEAGSSPDATRQGTSPPAL